MYSLCVYLLTMYMRISVLRLISCLTSLFFISMIIYFESYIVFVQIHSLALILVF